MKLFYFFKFYNFQSSNNSRGQTLIEYLIIVALIAVTTIGMIKAVGTNISVHFANIAKALAGDASKDISPVKVHADQVQTRDLHDYMKGAASGPHK
jgi:Flp pilus assembly pilin Flp